MSYASGKYAYGICDISGVRYKLKDMKRTLSEIKGQNEPGGVSYRQNDEQKTIHINELSGSDENNSADEEENDLKNNLDSTLNILEYAREKGGIPVVYAGSSSKHHGLYGSPYAWSKWQGEELCKLYNKVFGVPMGICRFYNVYGEYQLEDGDYATVLGIFEKQYREGRPLTITGDGEQRRDFTHIEDIVDGLVKCGNSLLIPNAYNAKVSGEEFELGRGINFSINELAEMFGENYPTKYIPARNGEYPSTLCTDENASKLLGWTPSKNVEDYIESIIK